MQCNRNFLETIAKNPLFRPKLKEMGFDPDKFDIPYSFSYFYKKLFKLTPAFQEKHDNYLEKIKPTIDTKLICAQVRIGGHPDLQKQIPNRKKEVLFQPVTHSAKYKHTLLTIVLFLQC